MSHSNPYANYLTPIFNASWSDPTRDGIQGIEEHFLEQWHQKLHTNTTPEDINICEAYLGCLHSGNPDDFWRLLWENGNITRDQLASMDRPITGRDSWHTVHLSSTHSSLLHELFWTTYS